MDTEKCPVCLQWIPVSGEWAMREHLDTLDKTCVMSGQETAPQPMALIA